MAIKKTYTVDWSCDVCGVAGSHEIKDGERECEYPKHPWATVGVRKPNCIETTALLCPDCAYALTRLVDDNTRDKKNKTRFADVIQACDALIRHRQDRNQGAKE